MKIIAYDNITKEGLTLKFDKKVAINGHLKVEEWWLSWDRVSELIEKGLVKKEIQNCFECEFNNSFDCNSHQCIGFSKRNNN